MTESMKMVMIVYNESLETEVMEVLENCALKNYTKILGVFGKGSSSGTHLGNDIWPGRNNLIYSACPQQAAQQILSCIRRLRQSLSQEGIKAFVLPIEEMT